MKRHKRKLTLEALEDRVLLSTVTGDFNGDGIDDMAVTTRPAVTARRRRNGDAAAHGTRCRRTDRQTAVTATTPDRLNDHTW